MRKQENEVERGIETKRRECFGPEKWSFRFVFYFFKDTVSKNTFILLNFDLK